MSRDSAIAEVLLPLALKGPYSYSVPPGMALEAGSYVAVPLGPRQMIGVVWALKAEASTEKKLRAVAGVFDMAPLPEAHRKFIDWLSAYYLEPMGNVLRMVLRSPGAFEGPREQTAYRATGTVPKRMTPQRARVLEIAREGFAMRAAELAEAAGVGTSVVKALAKDGALEAVALPALKRFPEPDLAAGGFALSKDQQAAAEALRAVVAQRQHKVMLLDGVTGSGKTEVYFEAMAAALASGGQVLLLLPEIALTQPFLTRVERRFGCEPAQWHSDVRPRERPAASAGSRSHRCGMLLNQTLPSRASTPEAMPSSASLNPSAKMLEPSATPSPLVSVMRRTMSDSRESSAWPSVPKTRRISARRSSVERQARSSSSIDM